MVSDVVLNILTLPCMSLFLYDCKTAADALSINWHNMGSCSSWPCGTAKTTRPIVPYRRLRKRHTKSTINTDSVSDTRSKTITTTQNKSLPGLNKETEYLWSGYMRQCENEIQQIIPPLVQHTCLIFYWSWSNKHYQHIEYFVCGYIRDINHAYKIIPESAETSLSIITSQCLLFLYKEFPTFEEFHKIDAFDLGKYIIQEIHIEIFKKICSYWCKTKYEDWLEVYGILLWLAMMYVCDRMGDQVIAFCLISMLLISNPLKTICNL